MNWVNWFEYAIVNLSAAAAIAMDACMLILLRFRTFTARRVALQWACALGLTHAVFPMVGFVGGWLAVQRKLGMLVYPLGAVLLGVLVYLVRHDAIDTNLHEDLSLSGRATGFTRILTFWIPIFYVSLDALLSGPGKTVLLERYPESLAWLSFGLVGLLVLLLTFAAGWLAWQMGRRWAAGTFPSPANLARRLAIGIMGELMLFTFFFVWCLAKSISHLPNTTHGDISLWVVLSVSLALGGTVAGTAYCRIKAAQLMRAKYAMGKEKQAIFGKRL